MRTLLTLAAAASLIPVVSHTAGAYTHDPSDFATLVVDYTAGTGIGTDFLNSQPYNDPAAALGRPTVDTTGDGWQTGPPSEAQPVVPVYPAFRSFEIVTVGDGGSLTLSFDHPVRDDPHNPFGIDFIVFGNSKQLVSQGDYWYGGDPNSTNAQGTGEVEPGQIEVSQDGSTFYPVTGGPFADTFAPTLGRAYDPSQADPSLGVWNQWWAGPTNPTMPLNPALGFADFGGLTVAQIAQAYEHTLTGEVSAGGDGIDLAWVDTGGDPALEWIQYVRIIDPDGDGVTTEIDAVSDVAPVIPGDLDLDGRVTFTEAANAVANIGLSSAAWSLGDFDGDDLVTVTDAQAAVDNLDDPAATALLTPTIVPEPGAAMLLLGGALVGLHRRYIRGK